MRSETHLAERLHPPPRRRWPLVTVALLLAVLSVIFGAKWSESRARGDQLQAELRQVYAEAESLRSRAVQAEQRIAQLENDLRALSARQAGARDHKSATTPTNR